MIGVFDSGFGGLSVLRELVRTMPNYHYLYLGDNARAPYGERSEEEIFQFTRAGVEFLFKKGAELVVVACNTASTNALRRIQQEILPRHYPYKRVLGIIIPTVEEVAKTSETKAIGVLATLATVASGAYEREFKKVDLGITVYMEACPGLVSMIEMGVADGDGFDKMLRHHIRALLSRRPKIDTVILGSTHYALFEKDIIAYLPRPHVGRRPVVVVSQGKLVAQKLKAYLKRHPEMELKLARGGERQFFTTERSPRVEALAARFYGARVVFERVRIDADKR